MANQIRTLAQHETSTSSKDSDLGAKNWSAAQIMAPLSFVVDICVEVQFQLEIKRWVTKSILDVAQIQQSHKPFQWAQVFVSMRTPRSAPGGVLFEEVSEVYQSGQVGSYIYRLTNGIAFMPDSRQASGEEDATFKLVYSNQQATTT